MTKDSLKRFAVVDLEATGASSSASIIQIGIVIIEDNKIVTTYETDINPHEKLSEHIKQLTGITDHQLSKAPEFSQVAREIYHLLEDSIFVAHNVKFDANLLSEFLFLEGYELRTPRIDTVELSQIFFPTLEKYSLSDLSELLHLELSDAHTAIADAMATARLFLKIKTKIEQLPLATLETLLNFKDSLLFESSLLIEDAVLASSKTSMHSYNEVGGILFKPVIESVRTLKQFSQSFEINLALLGLDTRPKQLAFAEQIEETYGSEKASFIEADTGIGKTYGYLLPLLAKNRNDQIMICVPTKLLQDQMMKHELRQIQEVFGITCHSLKGPSNYISLEKFCKTLEDIDSNRLVNRLKMQVLVWLLETETGDLDEVGQKQRFLPYFDSIRHDGKNIASNQFKDVDFWERNYKRAYSSRVLVINHAYFIERVQDDKEFASQKVLVFDEAQKLLLTLDEFSKVSIDLLDFLRVIKNQLAMTENILEIRLYENLNFEFSQWLNNLKDGIYYLNHDEVNRFKKTLKEIKNEIDFPLFPPCFEEIDTLWLEESDEDNPKKIYLKGGANRFLDFKSFLPELKSLYFISATLFISDNISINDLLGFSDSICYKNKGEPSRQQKIWIDNQMPLVTKVDEVTYAREVVLRLQALLQTDHQIIVLLTSKKALINLSIILEEMNIKHLAQDKHGTAFSLKKRFENKEAPILLGLGTFWEGVDFSIGDKFIEVIPRLPFDNPQSHFLKKIDDYLLKNGKNTFYNYTLPMMLLRLRQAFGRISRHDKQLSAILILDKRVLTKSYGNLIYNYLNQFYLVKVERLKNYLAEIIKFLL